MNSSELILQSLRNITLFGVVKWLFVMGLMMYIAFAVVIVRQVGVMTEALEDSINGLFSLFAWVHLLLAICLVVLAIVVL